MGYCICKTWHDDLWSYYWGFLPSFDKTVRYTTNSTFYTIFHEIALCSIQIIN
ncbi:MAG: hypothetical protein KA799_04865 [Bacteroidales bacterium]|nr:hypothetical protein [Bacteroidales bacterium]